MMIYSVKKDLERKAEADKNKAIGFFLGTLFGSVLMMLLIKVFEVITMK